jgi:hypothetical protein
MPTKQIKLTYQASPATGQDVTLVISVDSTVKLDQTVPAVGTAEQGVADPSGSVEFDLDVASATATQQADDHVFSITATNGRVKIETVAANFVVGFDPIANSAVAGDAASFRTCDIVSQPLWNGVNDGRYNIIYHRGPAQITGPGEILILPGETVVFTASVPRFNDSLPLPS